MNKKKEIADIIIGSAGATIGLLAVRWFNNNMMMTIPLVPRMLVIIAVYWVIAVVPVVISIIRKEPLNVFGFVNEKPVMQVITGVLIGLAMSVVLTLVPHLAGFGEFFDSGNRYRFLWQYVFEFTYCIVSVGFVEEFVFRGFIYGKIKKICSCNIVPLIISSVLFGLFHVFNGNLFQVFMTAGIGALFCFCRLKIKNCSTLSLIIAHGVYDAMITVWANALLR